MRRSSAQRVPTFRETPEGCIVTFGGTECGDIEEAAKKWVAAQRKATTLRRTIAKKRREAAMSPEERAESLIRESVKAAKVANGWLARSESKAEAAIEEGVSPEIIQSAILESETELAESTAACVLGTKDIEERAARLEQEVATLSAQNGQLEAEYESVYQAQEKGKEEIASLRAQRDQLGVAYRNLVQVRQGDLTSLQAQIKELEGNYDVAIEAQRAAERRLQTLQQERNRLESLVQEGLQTRGVGSQELANLQTQRDQCELRYETLLNAQIQARRELEAVRESNLNLNEELQQNTRMYEGQYSNLQTQFSNTVEDLKEQLAEAEQNAENINRVLISARNVNSALAERVQEFDNYTKDLEEEINEIRTQNTQLTQTNETQQETIKSQTDEINSQKQEIQNLNDRLEFLLSAQTRERENLIKQNNNLQQVIFGQSQEIGELQAQLTREQEEVQALQDQLTTQEVRLQLRFDREIKILNERSTEEINSLNNQVSDLKTENVRANNEIKSLQEEISDVNDDNINLRNANRELRELCEKYISDVQREEREYLGVAELGERLLRWLDTLPREESQRILRALAAF